MNLFSWEQAEEIAPEFPVRARCDRLSRFFLS
jgi:hypothetical protein